MSDKELLELAARAAGVPAYWSDDGTIQQRPVLVVKAGGGMGTMPYEAEWNPLRDADAAFHLAVKLHMSIDIDEYETSTYVYAGKSPRVYTMEIWNADESAATRRAIVRAAAEIGKTK